MEKIIEEMALELCLFKRDSCQDCERKEYCLIHNCAKCFYDLGYLKQVEAEWKFGEKNGQRGWYCTNCFAGFTGENAEWIAKEHNYCPKCGAQMKGE